MSLRSFIHELFKPPIVRPWALAAPILVLLIALPMLRPLRHPAEVSEDEALRLATISSIVKYGSLALEPPYGRFDEHKLLIVYGSELTEYERIFGSRGVQCNDRMKFITEAEHVHSSSDKFAQRFEELTMSLGMDGGQ
jgi:hypothetical protein